MTNEKIIYYYVIIWLKYLMMNKNHKVALYRGSYSDIKSKRISSLIIWTIILLKHDGSHGV